MHITNDQFEKVQSLQPSLLCICNHEDGIQCGWLTFQQILLEYRVCVLDVLSLMDSLLECHVI
jgi:hypothetical protein